MGRAMPSDAASSMRLGSLEPKKWQGKLHIFHDPENSVIAECKAINKRHDGKKPITAFVDWPDDLRCDLRQMKSFELLKDKIENPNTEWYAQISPTRMSGGEAGRMKFTEMLCALLQRRLALEVEFGNGLRGGSIFLFAHDSQLGIMLLGAYLPHGRS